MAEEAVGAVEAVVDIAKLKLPELRQELSTRGLDTKGNKQELLKRLQSFLLEHGDDGVEEVNEEEALGEETELVQEELSEVTEEPPAPPELPKPVEKPAVKKVQDVVLTSEAERLQTRAKRFNVEMNEQAKKAARAARFGIVTTETNKAVSHRMTSVQVDTTKLQERAKRFGVNVSTVAQKIEVEGKLKKRKERFGVVTAAAAVATEDTEIKKLKRAERFGIA
uniref:SAP domain containing ribonucleoprotein n=1 Tax=Petromyzon marinus TaxID=7757 RepID=S4RZZ5_PETMA